MPLPDVEFAPARNTVHGTLEERIEARIAEMHRRHRGSLMDERLIDDVRRELLAAFSEHGVRFFVKPNEADRMLRIGVFDGDVDEFEFEWRFGHKPEQDDLHRANCVRAGQFGHFICGMCPHHERPRFMCGCLHGTP